MTSTNNYKFKKSARTYHEAFMVDGQDCYFSVSNGQLEARADQRYWLNIHFRKMFRLLDLQEDDVFVDIGCGEGFHTLPLAAHARESYGFDFVESALAVLQNQTDYSMRKLMPVIAAGDGIPLPNETVDKLLCNHVLEHVVDDQAVLREIHRVLKPGGLVLIGIPLALSPQVKLLIRLRRFLKPKSKVLMLERAKPGKLVPDLIGRQSHIRFYSLDSLKKLLVKSGFEFLSAEGIGLSLRGCKRNLVRRSHLLLELTTLFGLLFPEIGDGVLALSRRL